MYKFSVAIITKNEEKNIGRCLESVKWADEIVIVDSGSTDKTLKICRKYNCKIIESEWLGFGKTKKFAVDSATNNWILSIDADEEVTPDLKKKILEILDNPKFNGYKIKRKSFYINKWINHCGWNKEYKLRLFNKQFGNFNEQMVHESVKLNGKIAKINKILKHYTYPNISSHLQKIDRYSKLFATELFKNGKKTSIFMAILKGKIKFLQMYFLQLGFLDGKEGFILSLNSAYGVYLKYLKLWEMNK